MNRRNVRRRRFYRRRLDLTDSPSCNDHRDRDSGACKSEIKSSPGCARIEEDSRSASFRRITRHARINEVTQRAVPPAINVRTTMSHKGLWLYSHGKSKEWRPW